MRHPYEIDLGFRPARLDRWFADINLSLCQFAALLRRRAEPGQWNKLFFGLSGEIVLVCINIIRARATHHIIYEKTKQLRSARDIGFAVNRGSLRLDSAFAGVT